eukprot:3756-Heterococcus_DN1.PRE.2
MHVSQLALLLYAAVLCCVAVAVAALALRTAAATLMPALAVCRCLCHCRQQRSTLARCAVDSRSSSALKAMLRLLCMTSCIEATDSLRYLACMMLLRHAMLEYATQTDLLAVMSNGDLSNDSVDVIIAVTLQTSNATSTD